MVDYSPWQVKASLSNKTLYKNIFQGKNIAKLSVMIAKYVLHSVHPLVFTHEQVESVPSPLGTLCALLAGERRLISSVLPHIWW